MAYRIYQYQVLIDWADDGSFEFLAGGRNYADCSPDLYLGQEFSMLRGRDYDSQIYGISIAGKLRVSLRNDSGTYTARNAASPIGDYIRPGLLVRAAALEHEHGTPIVMWTGHLDDIKPKARRGRQDTVRISALGVLEQLVQRDAETAFHRDITTADAMTALLDAASIPQARRGTINGTVTMPVWWATGKALPSARDIELTESGFIYEDRMGGVAMESGGVRLAAGDSPILTLSDESPAQIAAGNVPSVLTWYGGDLTWYGEDLTWYGRAVDGSLMVPVEDLAAEDPLEDIANVVRVPVRSYIQKAEQVLWSLEEATAVLAGQTEAFIVRYPDDTTPGTLAVDPWVTPLVAGTDYVGNSLSDGTGTDRTANLTVRTTVLAQGIRIDITNNLPAQGIHITTLQVRGRAIAEGSRTTVEREDAESVAEFGSRPYLQETPWRTKENALDFAGLVLLQRSEPGVRTWVTINANDQLIFSTLAALELSSLVTLDVDGRSQRARVEAVEHVVGPGYRHTVQLLVTDALPTSDIIQLGVGPGLGLGLLGQ